MIELSIVKTVLDGIQVIGSLVGTRKDLAESFQFGAEGLVVAVIQKRPVEDAVAIKVKSKDVWYSTSPTNLLETYFKNWNALPTFLY